MSETQPPNTSDSSVKWVLIVFGSLAILSIFAVVVLIAVALPMVQSSREAARREAAAENLRNIEIAIRNYESSLVTSSSSAKRKSSELTTIDSVRRLVSEQLGKASKDVTDNASLSDLGADELDFVEVVMSLEEHFEVSIPDEVLSAPTDGRLPFGKLTVRKLAEIVDRQRKAAGQ